MQVQKKSPNMHLVFVIDYGLFGYFGQSYLGEITRRHDGTIKQGFSAVLFYVPKDCADSYRVEKSELKY